MDPFFTWVEDGTLSTFLRESISPFVFPGMLVLHAIGMALLVGTHTALALRILGLAPRVPLSAMAPFVPVAWIGLGVNVFSGVLLLIAYPTKALTNPLFTLKMSFVVLALVVFTAIKRRVFSGVSPSASTVHRREKILASILLGLWVGTIMAGRFLAYTYTRLLVNL